MNSQITAIPTDQHGLGLPTLSTILKQAQAQRTHILTNPRDPNEDTLSKEHFTEQSKRNITGSPFFLKTSTNSIARPLHILFPLMQMQIHKWKIIRQMPPSDFLVDALCGLCGQSKATLTHVLALCPYSLGSMENDFNRITWRHNGILIELITSFRYTCRDRGFSIMVDIPGSQFHYNPFCKHRTTP